MANSGKNACPHLRSRLQSVKKEVKNTGVIKLGGQDVEEAKVKKVIKLEEGGDSDSDSSDDEDGGGTCPHMKAAADAAKKREISMALDRLAGKPATE